MHKRTSSRLFKQAASMRHDLGPAEVRLWAYLRAHRMKGIHFRRQHAIGNTIVDFCAPKEKLVIELDGSQHIENQQYDEGRTAFLATKGYRVIRINNYVVMNNIEDALKAIDIALGEV
jgi:very-short-patch-repair endonuclease